MEINFASHNFTYGSSSKGNFTWKNTVISYFILICSFISNMERSDTEL
jgi:hypothetical protein